MLTPAKTPKFVVTDPEIAELEQVIKALDDLWEEGEECIHPVTGKVVSNTEYDRLRKRLEELHPESELLKTPSAANPVVTVKKVRHEPPMTSISKAIGTLAERQATLKKFVEDVTQELNYADLPEKWMVQAYKRDGVAIALYYEHGKLVRAGLRPRNGYEGEDVTANAVFVEGIPTELWEHDRDGKRVKPLDVTCCIRGEVECKKSVFRKIKDDWQNAVYQLNQEPKNPRNYTAGSIRQFTDPTITKERKLSFVGYSIVGWVEAGGRVPFKTEIERAKYSNAVLRVPFVQVRPYRPQDLKTLEELADSLDYEVDGLVLSVNNLEDSEQMGNVGGNPTGNPKAKLAWKFAEQSALTEVRKIEWQVGRSGALTPVLQVDPVQLDGTTVSQCTGHSLGFLNGTSKASLGEISVGAEIRIIKSGKIIPKVVEIVKRGYQKFHTPHKCPSCGNALKVETGNDGSDLVCNNDYCGVRAVAHFTHYLATFGVKGIAESTLTKMYESGMVKDIADLYAVSHQRLEKIGFSKRQALLAVSRIWMHPDPVHADDDDLVKWLHQLELDNSKVKIPAWQLFASLGIPGAGKSAGQALISHFGNFAAVRNASLVQLAEVEGVADVTAKAIFDYFKKHKDMLDALLDCVEPENPKVGKFTGQTFVFTGGFPGGKQKWEKEVTERGGKVSGSVSKTTNYVVVGTDAGSKEEKAKQLGIARLTLADFEKMLP